MFTYYWFWCVLLHFCHLYWLKRTYKRSSLVVPMSQIAEKNQYHYIQLGMFYWSLLSCFLPPQEVMSVDEECTSCYCLLEARRCHLLLQQPGRYALVGEPLSHQAAKRLRLAVFGSPDPTNSLGFTLRVYCVDDTPHAFQVGGKTSELVKVLPKSSNLKRHKT